MGRTAGATASSTVRARAGRLSTLSVFHSKSLLYGAFVWSRRALNGPNRRFPGWAVRTTGVLTFYAHCDETPHPETGKSQLEGHGAKGTINRGRVCH